MREGLPMAALLVEMWIEPAYSMSALLGFTASTFGKLTLSTPSSILASFFFFGLRRFSQHARQLPVDAFQFMSWSPTDHCHFQSTSYSRTSRHEPCPSSFHWVSEGRFSRGSVPCSAANRIDLPGSFGQAAHPVSGRYWRAGMRPCRAPGCLLPAALLLPPLYQRD